MNGDIPFATALKILKDLEIFTHVPSSVIEEIARKMLISTFKENEKIINQGDAGNSMYVIFSGHVKVHDREFVIANLNAGSFFGEFSLLDDEPRSLSVSALSTTVTGCILQNDFYKVWNKHPEVTKDIIKVMLKRLRNQNQKIIAQLRQRQTELEELVSERTVDLRAKNEELILTLDELKRTQEQLVQQEKLASLGQLSSGIAHEIKNPLNFVNNFSQLSRELLAEMKDTKSQEDRDELLESLDNNLEKINHHGKRANSILQTMMEHTRTNNSEKQSADINKLCDQCMDIAYQNTLANNKNFVCDVKKNFEGDIAHVKIIPQDISKVILNILENAFYAVKTKRAKSESSKYFPVVSIATSTSEQFIHIKITDNGDGFSEAIRQKIFEPFFTTKPGVEGTGLGLSISYNIIKAHGGEIKAVSVQDTGTEFIVTLPVSK